MRQLLRVLDLPADRMEGEVVCALIFEDERPLRGPAALLDWRMNGRLTKMILEGDVFGRRGERLVIDGGSKILAPWVLFQGGGRLDGLSEDSWKGLLVDLLDAATLAGFSRLALCLAPLPGQRHEDVIHFLEKEMRRYSNWGGECLLSVDDSVRGKADKEKRIAH